MKCVRNLKIFLEWVKIIVNVEEIVLDQKISLLFPTVKKIKLTLVYKII